jgi:ABC-type polysaccharide/polyol phosphate transport system ATPase subunit
MNPSLAVEFHHVSKRFVLQQAHAPRSFQESLTGLFQRRPPSRHLWGLHDVSLRLEKGKTYGFIGSNGAGKSTALKLIARTLEPTSGSISVKGQVSALLELGAGFHPDLTGRENVFLNASIMGLSRQFVRSKFDEIVAFAELDEFIDTPVKHYSSGMYVRLGFAVAVHSQPDLLLVDEVLAVGDISFQRKCLTQISHLRKSGVTIVIVSHDVGAVQSLCDEIFWFSHGDLRLAGSATDVVMSYLRELGTRKEAFLRSAEEGVPVPAEADGDDLLGLGPFSDARWGTGQIGIVRVDFVNSEGRPTTSFQTGESMLVRLWYVAKSRVEEPVFGIGIHPQNGVQVCGPNTQFGGLDIPFVEGTGCVSYHIPVLPLLAGVYTVSVAAHDKSGVHMYDYHDRLHPFNVYPSANREQFGLITLQGDWAIG